MLSITAVGNLASDPVTREVGSLEVTNFTLLTSFVDKEGEVGDL